MMFVYYVKKKSNVNLQRIPSPLFHRNAIIVCTCILTRLSLNRGVQVPFFWMAKALTVVLGSKRMESGLNENSGTSVA